MVDLADLSRRDLQAALEATTDATAAKRVMAALAYLDGVDGATFAARYGVPTSTVYAWLGRFENRPVQEAMRDDPRPGRPPKLDEEGRTRLRADLAEPPSAAGYDAAEWDTSLVRDHLASAYGVAYSTAHVRRLLADLEPDSPDPR